MNLFWNSLAFCAADWQVRLAVSVPAMLMAVWLQAAVAQTTDQGQGTPADSGTGQQAQSTPVENAVLQGLLSGDLGTAVRYLASGGGGPEGVSVRAQALLRALDAASTGADPAQVQAVALAISDAVDQALDAAPVLGAQFGSSLPLSPQSFGFDFGTPDSAPTSGFAKITTNDPRLVTAGGRNLRRPEGTQLQTDGVVNLQQFQTGLPNGQWRVTLMTDDLGPDQGQGGPFGSELQLNEKVVPITGGNRSQWIPGALVGPGAENAIGGPRGGVVQSTVTVSNGRLIIDFGAGSGTYLTGLVLQPVEEPNIVRLTGEAARYQQEQTERSNRVRDVVAQGLGEILARVATAAGPNTLANALQANLVFNQPTAQVSEN